MSNLQVYWSLIHKCNYFGHPRNCLKFNYYPHWIPILISPPAEDTNVLRCWLSWWRHQMETISALLAIWAGNSPVNGGFPAQRPVTRSFHVSLMCAWMNGWVNIREAGHLRRHRAHHNVIVMYYDYYHICWDIHWTGVLMQWYHHTISSHHILTKALVTKRVYQEGIQLSLT